MTFVQGQTILAKLDLRFLYGELHDDLALEAPLLLYSHAVI